MAIEDYSKVIKLKPNDANTYVFRGLTKYNLGDINGACNDWRKAASLGYEYASQWVRDQCN